MDPVNSSPIKNQCSLKRNKSEIPSSITYNEPTTEKKIKLDDIPASQLGALSYISNETKNYTLSNKELIAFNTQAQRLKETNLASIPHLSNLTPEERKCLTSTLIKLGGFDEFLLTVTDNKPATLLFDMNNINIPDNIKDHKVLKKKIENDETRCYILNEKEVKKIVNENKELFETRLNATGKSTDEIYDLLTNSNTSPLLNDDINSVSDMVGLILGYPKTSSIIYHLAFRTKNFLRDKSCLENSKNNLIDYIYSDKSPYINMSEDFLSDLTDDIQNLTGHDFLENHIYEEKNNLLKCPIQCAVFLPESTEFMRIKNAVLKCTKKLSEL